MLDRWHPRRNTADGDRESEASRREEAASKSATELSKVRLHVDQCLQCNLAHHAMQQRQVTSTTKSRQHETPVAVGPADKWRGRQRSGVGLDGHESHAMRRDSDRHAPELLGPTDRRRQDDDKQTNDATTTNRTATTTARRRTTTGRARLGVRGARLEASFMNRPATPAP